MVNAYSIISDFSKEAMDILEENKINIEFRKEATVVDTEELEKKLEENDILIIGIRNKMTEDILVNIKDNKIIATLSIGIDHIAPTYFKSDKITVVNCENANVSSVAEHVFSLILALEKRLVEANRLVKNGLRKQDMKNRPEDILGKSIGIIGSGKIARRVIEIANVFKMNINCHTLNPNKNKDLLEKNVTFMELDELLEKSDIISVNIPLTDKTRNLISKEKIMKMKKDAIFIDSSRLGITDIENLIKYADENVNFRVGLDLDLENFKELFQTNRENVIATPHIAGVTKQAIKRMDLEIVNKIVNVMNNDEKWKEKRI